MLARNSKVMGNRLTCHWPTSESIFIYFPISGPKKGLYLPRLVCAPFTHKPYKPSRPPVEDTGNEPVPLDLR